MDIWVGLADAVPIDGTESEIGGVFVHVLAPAANWLELHAMADAALRTHGLRVADLDEAEPVRDRLRTGSLAPELLELALDAAIAQAARLGEFHAYPPEDHPDPDGFAAGGLAEVVAELNAAAADVALVSVRSHYDWHETTGYVAGVGQQWALVQLIDSCGLADGFRAVAIATVTAIDPVDPDESCLPRVLAARPLTTPAPQVDLDSTRGLLDDARREAALVYLVTDDMPPGAFWIGRISATNDDGVSLRKVSHAGEWWDAEDRFAYDTITRVGFGGRYAEALALAAGPRG